MYIVVVITTNFFVEIMNPKCKPYRDVYAAPGSELFQALVDGDHKKAARVYEEAKKREKALTTNQEN